MRMACGTIPSRPQYARASERERSRAISRRSSTLVLLGEALVVTACDVAQYILEQQGRMTAWKLQKLVYYSQAWSLVWDDEPLFPERIEAWANGPVVPALYDEHRGRYHVQRIRSGDSGLLVDYQRDTVEAVLETYGNRSSQWLSDLTHREPPWRDARRRAGLSEGDRGKAEIKLAAMADYYGAL